jgi:WD40 repeat protein
LVTGSHDGTVRTWDLSAPQSEAAPSGRVVGPKTALATAVLPDGRGVAVTAGWDDRVRVWHLADGGLLDETRIEAVWSVTSVTGRPCFASGRWGGTKRWWDLVSGYPMGADDPEHPRSRSLHEPPKIAAATAVLPDGRVVAVLIGWDDMVHVWDLAAGTHLNEPLAGHIDTPLAVGTAELPDGRVLAVTGGTDRTARVWDLMAGAPVGEPFTGHAGDVTAVATAVLGDGRAVAVTGGRDYKAHVWDLLTGTPVGGPLTGHTAEITALATAVLSDGRAVAVTGSADRTVRVWDLVTGAPVGEPLDRHLGGITSLAITEVPDGRVLAVTGSRDISARVWDLATGAPVGPLLRLPAVPTGVRAGVVGGRLVIVLAGDGLAVVSLSLPDPEPRPSQQPQPPSLTAGGDT